MASRPVKLKVEKRSIASLVADPENARIHDEVNINAIMGSLKTFGLQKPIVVSDAGVVIAGNGTLAAARALGWTEIDAVVTDLSGDEARAFALADNRTAELAKWDELILGKTLSDLMDNGFDLPSIGFDAAFLPEVSTPAHVDVSDVMPEGDEPMQEADPPDAMPDPAEGDAEVSELDEIPEVADHEPKPSDRISFGDCLEVLKTMREASVDSVVTDPPAGISFMGKEWDDDKGGRDQWVSWLTDVMKECHRVLKPGGHALVWAIPRTSHWTATALENAGFEIRDCVTHLFGSGFPKSMDISKAIDATILHGSSHSRAIKKAIDDRDVVGRKMYADGTGGGGKGVPTPGCSPEQLQHLLDAGETKGPDGKDIKLALQRYAERDARAITAPATDAAKQWQGFGTALKPAAEFWWLVRKPLSEKTVAANVLKHGTGGLNIDGCRIGTEERTYTPRLTANPNLNDDGWAKVGTKADAITVQGRFPANLVLSHNGDCDDACSDGCAVAELDRQSGFSKSPTKVTRGASSNPAYAKFGPVASQIAQGKYNGPYEVPLGYGDSGGASRFFYIAKASKRDKGAGNIHPTVKPYRLMSYLIRLITPPRGIVLDPFMGSGSTGVAALRDGFDFRGIEKERAYYNIAWQRIHG